jgi:DNA-binding transcriptional MerR regulator
MNEPIFYSSQHVATLYNITVETVRSWSEEFNDYLSPTANPGHRRTRLFSPDDMEVFALISQMKQQGQTFNDIHASLQAGQRGQPPELPPDTVQSVVIAERERQLIVQLQEREREIQRLKTAYDDLQQKLDAQRSTHEENIRLKVKLETLEEQLTELKANTGTSQENAEKRLHEAQKRIQELEREVGTAYSKGVLDALRKRGELPD